MFRPSSPQMSFFESQYLIPPERRARMVRSWAQAFREVILPAIDEEAFRGAFAEEGVGRPNKPIRQVLGVLLLKDMFNLTDGEALDQYEYNVQWHHALGVESAEAHMVQKTLHNTRVRLLENDRAREMFQYLTRKLVETDGLSVARQRLDSTHIVSNIALLTRLGLFTETAGHLLRELRKYRAEALNRLDAQLIARYDDSAYSDVPREQVQRRLSVAAQDLYRIVGLFADDADVCTWESYHLAARLLSEQCWKSEEDVGVILRQPKDVSASSLQSPHDPDATYGHKGKGYEAQIAETCVAENAYQVITDIEVNGAHESDANALQPALARLEESGFKPEKLVVDTGYGSGQNIVAAAEEGVELIARVRDPGAPEKVDAWSEPPPAPEAETAGANPPTPEAETAGASPAAPAAVTMMAVEEFSFNDTFSKVSSCPAGQSPVAQSFDGGRGRAEFAASGCAGCPFADRCPTKVHGEGERILGWKQNTTATAQRQREQQQPPFKAEYRIRAGIESTNAEIKHRHGADELRVRGGPNVRLAMLLKAAALNIKRCVTWHARKLAEALRGPQIPTIVPA